MTKENCIIVDIDGTLANIEHRRLHLSENNDWKSFQLNMDQDSINNWCKILIDQFKNNYKIFLLTGREATHKEVTLKWLAEHSVYYDDIFFREEKDYREDSIIKKELFQNHINDNYSTLFVVDDRLKVVKMWREIGLTCLQCDWGNF